MPNDLWDDEDEQKEAAAAGPGATFAEFDCPDCNANNPCDPRIGDGDQTLCNYCGESFEVHVTEGGKLKLKAL